MFNQYPYINLNDLNLDYILKAIKEMRNEVTNFVSINAIKYADPIQWNITSQYEKNTIVIDPQTGTAYISVAPVPAGVALNRPEYWTVVFDLGAFVTRAAKNFTVNYEEETTLTATFNTTAGEWLIWGDTLYVAKVNITAGDSYVVDGNIERITVEEVKNNLITIIDGYYDTITGIIGELADLTTSDTDSIVDAINSIITERGALSDLTTSDTDSIVDAINSIITERGALSNLNTSDKTNIVAAINEVDGDLNTLIAHNKIINVLDYGAVGDGVTDDTNAIKDAINVLNVDGGVLYFPQGRYLISDTLNITHVGSCVRGDTQQGTFILQSVDKTALHFGNGVTPTISYRVEHIGIVNTASTVTSATYGIHYDYAVNSTIEDVVIGEFYVGLFLTHTGNSFIKDVGVVANRANAIGFNVGDQSVSSSFNNCYVGFSGLAVDTAIGFYCARGDIADISIDYMDIGNGAYGLFFNGTDSPNDYPPADIRLRNIVVDGSRVASIHIQDIIARGNVVIDGGWLNPHITATSHCIELSNANNIMISNVVFQQLAELVAPTIIAITLYQTTNVNIEHCEFLNVAQVLSAVSTDKTSFVNNHVRLYTGMSAAGSIIYLGTAYTSIITNNNFYGNYPSGITFDSNGDYSIVIANIFTGVTTAITDPHTNKSIDNNLT